MTVAALPSSIDYVENGVTLAFAVPFRFLSGSLDVSRVLTSGAIQALTAGVDYTEGGGDTDAGGELMLMASVSGAKLRIRRRTPRAQSTQYPPGDRFPAKSHEEAVDRAMLIDQEQDVTLNDVALRALMVPDGEAAGMTPARSARLNKYFGWDAAGNVVALSGTGADAGLRTDLATALVGANLIAYLEPGTSAAERTLADKIQRDMPLSIRSRIGATGDGVADDRGAVVAADANGPFMFTPGIWRIASNTTISQDIIVMPGALIKPTNGAIVQITGDIIAGHRRIFDVSQGTISGLKKARLEWFVGHLAGSAVSPPVTECRSLIQAAISAVAASGKITAGPGHWLIDGTTPIDFVSQSFEGAGKYATVFRWQGASTSTFRAPNNGGRGGYMRGFRFQPHVAGTIPTSGTGLYIGQSDRQASDFFIQDAFDAVVWKDFVIGSAWDFQLKGTRRTGFMAYNSVSDLRVRDFVIESLSEWITMTGISGTFQNLETVTLTGGTKGIVTDIYGGGKYRIMFLSRKPVNGNTITGDSSGASGTVSAVTVGHALGGIRWFVDDPNARQEAMCFDDGDVLGGELGFTASGKGVRDRDGNPAYNKLGSGLYFDTTWSGSITDGLYGTEVSSWFTTSRSQDAFGLAMLNAGRIRGTPHLVNNAGDGLQVEGSCDDIEFHNIDCEGNNFWYSPGAASSTAEIKLIGAVQRFRLIGGRAGYTGDNGTTPLRAIWIDSAAADHLKFIGISVPSGSVTNGATGSNQWWIGVEGVPERYPISHFTNAANDTAAASAGVPVGGLYRNGSQLMIRAA